MADSTREIDVKKQMGDPKQAAHVSAGTSQDKADVFFSGPCEVEVSEGGEVDLQQHYHRCEKNPGHQKFVPVHQFSRQHLPSAFRDHRIMNLIRAMSELTVRVSVKYVSERRPQTWPGSDQPYPFCSVGRKDMLRTGTGWVTLVKKMEYGFHEWGGFLKTGEEPYEIYIKTAAHVVYDNLEAAHTTCHLFFHQGGTPDLCPGVVTLTGMSIINTDMEKDFCEMRCVTRASDLAYRLKRAIEKYVSIEKYVYYWHRASLVTNIVYALSPLNFVSDSPKVLTIIVSHPHGCSKQVSVGHCVSRVMEHGTFCSQLTYTTPTCTGSSGAHVFLLGNRKDDHQHVHVGSCDGKSELNHSSKGRDSFYYNLRGIIQQQTQVYFSTKDFHMSSVTGYDHVKLLELVMQELERKDSEYLKLLKLVRLHLKIEDWPRKSEFTLVNNPDLGQHHEKCPKFPVYLKLIPEDSFSMDYLFCEFQDPEVKHLICGASDLIVRVSVRYDPELWHLDSNLIDTGYVLGVTTYHVSCIQNDCKKCQVQPFARIYIRTKASFFSDKKETKDISCDFFFDRGSRSNKYRNPVTFHGMPQVVRTEEDLCVVMYETHDLVLAYRLEITIKRCEFWEAKLMPKYHDKLDEDIHHLPPCEYNLAIILSYTERTAKMRESDPSQVTYNTPTCPGSAMAQVLGSDRWEPSHVQTGTSDLIIEYSHSWLLDDLDISSITDEEDDDNDAVDRIKKTSEDACHEHVIIHKSMAVIPCLAQFMLDDKCHYFIPSYF